MKKILSILELKNSKWPTKLQETLKGNLISAFVHGDALVEGFNALENPWTISFILRDNSTENLTPLLGLLKEAKKENIQFKYFFTLKEIQTSEDVFPLEFLHIANRNEEISGSKPLPNYEPNLECLRLECERELRGILIHLRKSFMMLSQEKHPLTFFTKANGAMLPILYGVYYLVYKEYPKNHQTIFSEFPELTPPQTKDKTLIYNYINNYINAVTKIVNQVDTMDVV